RRCADLPWAEFHVGDANTLPYEDGSFDVATATQIYNYVADLPTALRELYRVLRPGGRALVLETDWDALVWNTTDRERMRRVLTVWLEHSAHAYLPRALTPLLRNAGFHVTHEAVFPLFNPRYAPDTFSYGLIDFIVSFVQGRAGVSAEEAQAWADELRERGQADEYFFSLNRYVFLAARPEN
ncbi:MAG TPA: methyltransferase domain-containing protein, partial [Ktedonobacterales bacterium]